MTTVVVVVVAAVVEIVEEVENFRNSGCSISIVSSCWVEEVDWLGRIDVNGISPVDSWIKEIHIGSDSSGSGSILSQNQIEGPRSSGSRSKLDFKYPYSTYMATFIWY